MTNKPKDSLPESVPPHVPQLDEMFAVEDVSAVVLATGLALQNGVSVKDVSDGLTVVSKFRLFHALTDFAPHPRNYYDRLKKANAGLQQALLALTPGPDWRGHTNWPRSHLQQDSTFDGCEQNYDPLSAALAAARWLKESTRTAMEDLETGGLRKPGSRSVQSRNHFLSGIARLYSSSFGVPYTYTANQCRPFYKFIQSADELLIAELADSHKEVLNAEVADLQEEVLNAEVADLQEEVLNAEVADLQEEVLNAEVADLQEEVLNAEVADLQEEVLNAEVADLQEEVLNAEVADLQEEVLNAEVADLQEDLLPYAMHSSVRHMSFDDMHAVLRKDKSVS